MVLSRKSQHTPAVGTLDHTEVRSSGLMALLPIHRSRLAWW